MTAPPDSLAAPGFWREYWQVHDPVRVIDGGFYFAELLHAVLEGSDARSFLELGGFPGHFAVYARKHLGLESALLDSYVDAGVVDALLACNGLAPGEVAVIEADMFEHEPQRRYDVVLSAGLVEHFVDPVPVLRRHLDYVTPHGILVVTMPNYLGINGWLQACFDPDHLAAHNLETMAPERLRTVLAQLPLAGYSVDYYGRFRVWLEELSRRPLPLRLLVYSIQALGLGGDLVRFRSRWTTPHVAVVATAGPGPG